MPLLNPNSIFPLSLICFLFSHSFFMHVSVLVLMVSRRGARLLSSWLESERLIGFCKLLGRNTAKIKAEGMSHGYLDFLVFFFFQFLFYIE